MAEILAHPARTSGSPVLNKMKKKLLGNLLLEQRLLTSGMLRHALRLQQEQHKRLGDIIMAEGMIGTLPLHETLAIQLSLPFINLLTSPPDSSLYASDDALFYLKWRFLPYRRERGFLVLATCDPSDTLRIWAQRHYKMPIRFFMTSPLDLRRCINTLGAEALSTRSVFALWHHQPHLSARKTITTRQKLWLLALVGCLLLLCLFRPWQTILFLSVMCQILYTITMLFKWHLFRLGRHDPLALRIQHRITPCTSDAELPIYTILVPMYDEASVLPALLTALRSLDYPKSKLDIKLILEEQDKTTLHAVHQLKPEACFEVIIVPHSHPRTKPKACNYALQFARGEFVTIFDAEDRPDPQQLRKAVAAFRCAPDDIACLQARLEYFNVSDNLLTYMFAIEYALLFQHLLPGLQRMGAPIPLGGTSNHISLRHLRQADAWDPFNVTEDADLGIRLASRGLRTTMLDSSTREESPNTLYAWLRQRTRWTKGHMQTWLVHMRSPVRLWKQLGPTGFIGFQCFIGLPCFVFLSSPLVWILSVLWIINPQHSLFTHFPLWTLLMALGNLCFHCLLHWHLALVVALENPHHRKQLMIGTLFFPAYWILHCIASYRALFQLIYRPFLWEKTTHGVAHTGTSTSTS